MTRLIDADVLLKELKKLSFPIELDSNVMTMFSHDVVNEIINAPTVEQVSLPEGWIAVPVELLKDITNCFDNVPSRAHVVNSIDENLKRIAQWVNSSDGGYGLYQAVNHYLQTAPTLNEKG